MTTPVLTFRRRAPNIESEVARLGAVPIGEIIPLPPGLLFRANWVLRLPGNSKQGGARKFEEARKRIEDGTNEWLVAAGVLDPGAGVIVTVEACDG